MPRRPARSGGRAVQQSQPPGNRCVADADGRMHRGQDRPVGLRAASALGGNPTAPDRVHGDALDGQSSDVLPAKRSREPRTPRSNLGAACGAGAYHAPGRFDQPVAADKVRAPSASRLLADSPTHRLADSHLWYTPHSTGMRGIAARQYAFLPLSPRRRGTPSRTDRLEPFPSGATVCCSQVMLRRARGLFFVHV